MAKKWTNHHESGYLSLILKGFRKTGPLRAAILNDLCLMKGKGFTGKQALMLLSSVPG